MSLLLKALKQAEAANAGKPEADRGGKGAGMEDTLELEPLSAGSADSGPGWVEPPALVFGHSGPASTPRPAPAFRLPQLSLVPVVALLAGVIAVGYGIYLYLALQPPDTALPAPPTAPVAEPAMSDPAPIVASAVPAPSPVGSVPSPIVSAPSAGVTGPASRATAEVPAIPVRPVAAAASPAAPAAASVSAPSTAVGDPAPPPERQAARATRDSTLPAAPIRFQPDAQSALLSQAHAAYQRGALGEAQRLYSQAAARTRSVDALLGLAAIASVQNREIDAQRLYRDVLDVNPRNATAQAALLDLLGNTDGPATESRLKMLIDRDPGPQLYQTLGNLYADQKRWSDAQAAYFEAYRYAPDNADYAFNLAVSLDQLGQDSAALRYYEKALATDGAHRFDRAQATARVQQLKSAR
ncbi:MAG: hypothetical protein ACLGHA_07485 [Gammaproteobacteria bacterium]